MPKEFKSKINGRNVFSDEFDLVSFNKELRKHRFSDLESFKVRAFSRDVFVDLKRQKIFVDGVEQFLDLKSSLYSVRWVSFKRHTVSYRMIGGRSKNYKIGVGFQGFDKSGFNVQRFLLFDEGGFSLYKKR